MRVQLPHLFSQFDKAWADTLLGENTDPKFNIYNYGCLLACLTMIAEYYGKEEDLLTLNKKIKDLQGFKNGGEYVWGTLSRIHADIQESIVPTPSILSDAQIKEIKDALDAGFPVILGIDYNPKTIEPDYHFVVAVDYNPKDENDFTIADPLGGMHHSLKDFLGWLKPNVRKTIERYAIFRGPLPLKPEINDVPAGEAPPILKDYETGTGGGLPSNFDDIVHNSTEWDKTVSNYGVGKSSKDTSFEEVDSVISRKITEAKGANVVPSEPQDTNENWRNIVTYLELDKNPEDASFENVKRVIAGIKSRQTDLENKAKKASENEATSQVSITNLQEDIGILKGQLTTEDKLHKAELNSLKENLPSFDKLKGQYRAMIDEQHGKILEQNETIKDLRIQLAKQDAEQSFQDEPQVSPVIENSKQSANLLKSLLRTLFSVRK